MIIIFIGISVPVRMTAVSLNVSRKEIYGKRLPALLIKSPHGFGGRGNYGNCNMMNQFTAFLAERQKSGISGKIRLDERRRLFGVG